MTGWKISKQLFSSERRRRRRKKKINIINLLRNESPSISRPFALNALLTFIASNLSQISGKAAKNYGRLEAKLILVYEAKKKWFQYFIFKGLSEKINCRINNRNNCQRFDSMRGGIGCIWA